MSVSLRLNVVEAIRGSDKFNLVPQTGRYCSWSFVHRNWTLPQKGIITKKSNFKVPRGALELQYDGIDPKSLRIAEYEETGEALTDIKRQQRKSEVVYRSIGADIL